MESEPRSTQSERRFAPSSQRATSTSTFGYPALASRECSRRCTKILTSSFWTAVCLTNLLQPIPCAILRYENKILFVRRKKPGHPLHDTYAVWAGGHVSEIDNGADILVNALERELSEELFIREAFNLNRTPVALIRTSEDARASRHIGVLYEVELQSENVALALNQKEFRETRGSSMSGRLVEICRIAEYYSAMGDWSKFIVDRFWPDQAPSQNNPPTLFVEPT